MRELAAWVYRILRSKALGALVIIAMAVLTLLGTLITQEPAGSAGDPTAHAQFLESMQARYGGWTLVLDVRGIFNLWASPLFLGVTVLLALSIIACTAHRVPQLWRRATQPRIHVTGKFFDRASRSRHAASARNRPITSGLRDCNLIRSQASSGSRW